MMALAASADLAAAPADAAPASAAPVGGSTPGAPASRFDAILNLLEATVPLTGLVPGTPTQLATDALPSAGAAESLLADEPVTADSDVDDSGERDSEDSDLDAALAFLANLIAVTRPPAPPAQSNAAQQDLPAQTSDPLTFDMNEPRASSADSLLRDPLATSGNALQNPVASNPNAALMAGGWLSGQSSADKPAQDAAQSPPTALARAVNLLSAPRVAESSHTVLTHARDPRWADDFSQRISLVLRAGESTATLALTPVDLGPVEVQVSVKDSQASIVFAATQADTRALIEASLPRLRELLASQGFNLLDASVSSGFSRSSQSGAPASARSGSEADAAAEPDAPVVRRLGLLDLYA